jgi:DNA-binding MarR family transcriptional regulator
LKVRLPKEDAIRGIANRMQELQEAAGQIDENAARLLGLNRTDLRCLSRLRERGRLTAGELAVEAGLTPAATTTAIDRLERAGYARRIRDDTDRRRVLVTPTQAAVAAGQRIWGPVLSDAFAQFKGYTLAELAIITRFLDQAVTQQRRHAQRLRAVPTVETGGGG